MIYDICDQLGLTPKEFATYKVLLKLGEVPVSSILNETQDHPQIVYRALDGLISKELVQVSIKKHKKYVLAEDPAKLEKIAEKRIGEVKKLIPELVGLQSKAALATMIKVYKGVDGVRDARATIVDELPEGGVFYLIGASGKRYFEIMGSSLKNIENKRVRKKIERKVIGFEAEKVDFMANDRWKELSEYRFLPQNFSVPSTTAIYGKKIALFVYSEEPFVISIESAEVADSYKQYFDSLWEIAKA